VVPIKDSPLEASETLPLMEKFCAASFEPRATIKTYANKNLNC